MVDIFCTFSILVDKRINNTKGGGVCIYYKESLGINVLDVLLMNVY